MNPTEQSYILRRLEKVEAQVKNINKGGDSKAVKSKNKETIVRAICRNEDGLESNRLVRIWTRKIDDGDPADDEMGGLPSCDYIDSNNSDFRYGVTVHKVNKENDVVSIQITGAILIAFESNENTKVKYGTPLFPISTEGKIAGFGDDIYSLNTCIALESENDDEEYTAIKCLLMTSKDNSWIKVKNIYEDIIPDNGVMEAEYVGDYYEVTRPTEDSMKNILILDDNDLAIDEERFLQLKGIYNARYSSDDIINPNDKVGSTADSFELSLNKRGLYAYGTTGGRCSVRFFSLGYELSGSYSNSRSLGDSYLGYSDDIESYSEKIGDYAGGTRALSTWYPATESTLELLHFTLDDYSSYSDYTLLGEITSDFGNNWTVISSYPGGGHFFNYPSWWNYSGVYPVHLQSYLSNLSYVRGDSDEIFASLNLAKDAGGSPLNETRCIAKSSDNGVTWYRNLELEAKIGTLKTYKSAPWEFLSILESSKYHSTYPTYVSTALVMNWEIPDTSDRYRVIYNIYSTDSGTTWSHEILLEGDLNDPGYGDVWIRYFTTSPTNLTAKEKYFCASSGSKIGTPSENTPFWISDNSGVSWSKKYVPSGYAVSGDFRDPPNKIYWIRDSTNLPDSMVLFFVMEDSSNARISHLIRSDDLGDTWTELATLEYSDVHGYRYFNNPTLLFSEREPGTIFCVGPAPTLPEYGHQAIWISFDWGVTFELSDNYGFSNNSIFEHINLT